MKVRKVAEHVADAHAEPFHGVPAFGWGHSLCPALCDVFNQRLHDGNQCVSPRRQPWVHEDYGGSARLWVEGGVCHGNVSCGEGVVRPGLPSGPTLGRLPLAGLDGLIWCQCFQEFPRSGFPLDHVALSGLHGLDLTFVCGLLKLRVLGQEDGLGDFTVFLGDLRQYV
jgi:hypothetical protein